MEEKQKILIFGDVCGRFKTLFRRVESINNKKGPFECVLCVGDFFGSSTKDWERVKNGTIKVPVTTYVLGPNRDAHKHFYENVDNNELSQNISYLGNRGVFTLTGGLRVVYVSGTRSGSCQITESDVVSVRDICIKNQSHFRGVDVLLTSEWPKDVCSQVEKPPDSPPAGSPLLSWLAAQIKPRYHFSGLYGIHYERPPYRNAVRSGESTSHCSRFISLGVVGNDVNVKFIYALNIVPLERMKEAKLLASTIDETRTPYEGALEQRTPSATKESGTSQFFYDMKPPMSTDVKKRIRKEDRRDHPKRSRPTFDQEKCWFCLASPKVEKHLVVSIGNDAYLALAKGGLVDDHVLILPVGHHQSIAEAPDSVVEEIEKFKKALKKMFTKQKKAVVFYERNYKTSHLQVQAIPVPLQAAPNLKDIFEDAAEAQNVELCEVPEDRKLSQLAPRDTPYFYAELPQGERLFHRIRQSFSLNFGREVLASGPVLDMDNRADWQDCKRSQEEETQLTKDFRKHFEPFDFTL